MSSLILVHVTGFQVKFCLDADVGYAAVCSSRASVLPRGKGQTTLPSITFDLIQLAIVFIISIPFPVDDNIVFR